MAIDRVQVLKQESAALGGDDADSAPWPAPIEPQEDAIEAAGLYLQDNSNRDENVSITRAGDDMSFTDVTNPSYLLSNFAVLIGRVGGQTFIGSQDSTGDLTLQSTSNASKGHILFGNSGYDEAYNRLGIGILAPTVPLDVAGASRFGTDPYVSIPASANEIDFSNNGPNYFDATAASGDFRFRTGGSTEALRLTSTQTARFYGDVGIGTDPTTAALTIATTTTNTINAGDLIFTAGAVPLFGFRISNANAYLDLDASWTGSETTPVMRIGRNTRYVGIGNFGASSAPDAQLHIRRSDAGSISPNSNTTVTIESASAGNYLSFLSPATTVGGILFGDPTNGNADGVLYYYHSDRSMRFAAGGATRARLNSSGHFRPEATTTQDLGLTGSRWGTLYATRCIIGTAPYSANVAVNIERTSASASSEWGLISEHIFTSALAGAKAGIEARLKDDHSAGNLSDVRGFFSYLDKNDIGAVTAYYMFRSYFEIDPPSTAADIGQISHFFGEGNCNSDTSISNIYGFRYSQGTLSSGAVANQYGLFVGTLTQAVDNVGIYIATIGTGANDYAIYSINGRTFCSHTYTGTTSHAAHHFDYNVNVASGASTQQGLLCRMTSNITADYGSTVTSLYVQSIKAEATYNLSNWVGVYSRLQDSSASGQITQFKSFASSVNKDGFNITNCYHYFVEEASGTGTITTQAGLYVEKLDNGTNNYGIYSGGSGSGINDYSIFSNDGQVYLQNTYVGSSSNNHVTADLTIDKTGGSNTHYAARITAISEFDTSNQTGTWGAVHARVHKSDPVNSNATICYRATLAPSGTTSGTITGHYGVFSEVDVTGFTVSNLRHCYIKNAIGSGTVTAQYGLYVTDLIKGTTNYGVYIAGASTAAIYVAADDVVFRGRLAVGPSSPSTTLHVRSANDNVAIIESTDASCVLNIADSNSTSVFANGIVVQGDLVSFSQASVSRWRYSSTALYPLATSYDLGTATAANTWDNVYCEKTRTYDTGQVPGSQADLLIRNQQNLTVARCKMDVSTPTSPSIVGHHWNVASVSRVVEGHFRFTLDEAVDDDSTIVVSLHTASDTTRLYCWNAAFTASGGEVNVYTFRIGQGAVAGIINTTGSAAYISRDDADIVYITMAVIGRPNILE